MERSPEYYKAVNKLLIKKSFLKKFIPVTILEHPNYVANYVEITRSEDADGFKSYKLTSDAQTVQTSVKHAGITISSEMISDTTENSNIDIVAMSVSALVQDTAMELSKDFLRMLNTLASKHKPKLKFFEKIQAFIYKLLNKEFVKIIKVKSADNLVAKMQTEFRNITFRCRKNGTYFAIVGPYTSSLLQRSKYFQYTPSTEVESTSFFPVGSIMGIKIYVNAFAHYWDRDILMGRNVEKGDPGLQMFLYEGGTKEDYFQMAPDPKVAPSRKLTLELSFALEGIGKSPEDSYAKITYKERKPLLKK